MNARIEQKDRARSIGGSAKPARDKTRFGEFPPAPDCAFTHIEHGRVWLGTLKVAAF